MSVPPVVIREVVTLLQRGELDQAEQELLALLAVEPENFAGLHLLGVLFLERGDPARAMRQFDHALQLNRHAASVHYNRGNALSALHRLEEAAESYDAAISLQPEFAEAYYNRGNTLRGLGRAEQAVACYRQAIALKPALFQAHNNLGSVLQAQQRLPEALASFEQALAFKPDHVEAIINRGMVLQQMQRLEEALAAFDRAIALDGRSADAFNNRGLALQELNRVDEAIASYDQAIVIHPTHCDAWSNRGGALVAMKLTDAAIASCERAIALDPTHASAINNRGIALHEARKVAEALSSYDQAIALRPDFTEAWNNRGNALHDLRRMNEALSSFERAIELRPSYAEAINNRGMVRQDLGQLDAALADYNHAIDLRPGYVEAFKRRAGLELLRGNFAEGWADFELGLENSRLRSAAAFGPGGASIPFWRGENLAGKKILLSEPNGLGDTLQFIRLVPRLLAQGAAVSLLCPASFFRVLAAFSDRIHFISEVGREHFDFQCWLWSLPHYLNLGADNFAQGIPYLCAEPALVDKWSGRLDRRQFNIGVCWQGNPERKIDAGRSMALSHFFPLSQVPGVRLISLQKHFGLDQLDCLPAGMSVESPGDGFDDGPDAFVDSAALLQRLDLLIAADTSITHLAGALGRPAWLALGFVPDWRWLLERADSPWYPSIRLFRQQRIDDWSTVFEAMADALITLGQDGGYPGRLGQS